MSPTLQPGLDADSRLSHSKAPEADTSGFWIAFLSSGTREQLFPVFFLYICIAIQYVRYDENDGSFIHVPLEIFMRPSTPHVDYIYY